jgi:[acyl-carrier-protein] S-malonyltransferase
MGEPERHSAVIFPGQGSQHDSMRELVARDAPHLLDLATEVVGCDPFEHLDEGTAFVQPAVYCASVASWHRLAEEEAPAAVAGHSFGEFAALVAAGVIDEEEGLRLVALRGRLTDEVGRSAGGGMLAVMGGTPDEVERMARESEVHLATDNSPRQAVLSGPEPELAHAEEKARKRRWKVKRLKIAGAFHSPAMRPAALRFARAAERLRLSRARFPVWSCVTADRSRDVPRELVAALTAPVRWRRTVERLHATGIDRFVEAAPGRALSGLVRRTVPSAATEAVESGARAGGAA